MNNLRFDFEDINLVPRYSTVNSRSECDTSIKFGKHTFKNPVIPANMESVINEKLAIKLATEGWELYRNVNRLTILLERTPQSIMKKLESFFQVVYQLGFLNVLTLQRFHYGNLYGFLQ